MLDGMDEIPAFQEFLHKLLAGNRIVSGVPPPLDGPPELRRILDGVLR
jgi:hypothetical protein